MGLLSFVHGETQFSKNAFKGYRSTLELELFTINIQLSHHAKMGFILRH